MAPLPEEEFRHLLKGFGKKVRSPTQKIREAQEEVLLALTDPGQIARAYTLMTIQLGRSEVQMTNNVTNK